MANEELMQQVVTKHNSQNYEYEKDILSEHCRVPAGELRQTDRGQHACGKYRTGPLSGYVVRDCAV